MFYCFFFFCGRAGLLLLERSRSVVQHDLMVFLRKSYRRSPPDDGHHPTFLPYGSSWVGHNHQFLSNFSILILLVRFFIFCTLFFKICPCSWLMCDHKWTGCGRQQDHKHNSRDVMQRRNMASYS